MNSVHDFTDVKDGLQNSLKGINELVEELKGFENEHFRSDVTLLSYDILLRAITNATLDDRQRFSVSQIKELELMRATRVKDVFEKGDD